MEYLYNGDYGSNIFIFAGQSNAVGVGAIPSDMDYSTLANVYQYQTRTNIDETTYGYDAHTISQLASGGLYHPMSDTTQSVMGIFLTFLQDYVKYNKIPRSRRILCVPCAWSATSLSLLGPNPFHTVDTGKCYNITVKAVQDCMAINPMSKIQGFLWNQGESDISAKNMNYQKQYEDMINGFIRDISGFTDKTPIVNGQVGSLNDDFFLDPTNTIVMKKFINEIFENMSKNKQNYGFARSYDLNMPDRVHYDVESFKILGRRYHDAYLKCIGVETPKPSKQQNLIVCPEKIQVVNNLSLKPINKKGWVDSSLSGFGTTTLTLLCTLAHTGNAVFKIVKLGSLVILTLKDTITFTAGSAANIRIVAGGLPSEVMPIEDSITVTKGLKASALVFIDWQFLPTGEINIKPSEEATFENAIAYTLYPFSMIYEAPNNF